MVLFRHYTNLAATMHLLWNKEITLLDPSNWDDANDRHYLEEFQRRMRHSTVLAICFAECEETYHHWRVFSEGPHGVCIIFDKEAILATFDHSRHRERFRHGAMEYRLLDDMRDEQLTLDRLPFYKRNPYRGEQEYRVIYAHNREKLKLKSFPVDLRCIKRVTLSPWLPIGLRQSVQSTLQSIPGCQDLEVTRSTLVGNKRWMKHATRAESDPA